MKRIVICCDGTWNRLDARHQTNVARLSEAIPGDGGKDAAGRAVAQVVYHLDGVGSGRGTGDLARAADRIFGGAFGWGLDALVIDAYRFLVLNYDPGDRIYLFGFSRGAYCARSLCGLIRRAGILERRRAREIPKAMALYRNMDKEARPDGAAAKAFRARNASHVTTVEGEEDWRARWIGTEEGKRAADQMHPAPTPLRLAYLGVWDTVGALGVPQGLIARGLARLGVRNRHMFHDTKLSPLLDAARHAIAIDERRNSFAPARWGLDDLRGARSITQTEGWERRYLQQWFPGAHCAVGGGGSDETLALGALRWIAEGAGEAGLRLDEGMLEGWAKEARFNGPINGGVRFRGPLAAYYRIFSGDRPGIEAFDDISDVARRRWLYARYRSKLLGPFGSHLKGWRDPEPPPDWLPPRKPDGRGGGGSGAEGPEGDDPLPAR